jgi:Ca2+-transporting ATPase
MRFVFAVHVPIAGLTLLPLLLGWPLLFTPMHIAFLEIVIDPVCSIAFEAEEGEADLMARPPRDPAAALFSPAMILSSLMQGATVLALVGGFYAALLHGGAAEGVARAAAFVALVVSNIALILANRSSAGAWRAALARGNRALAAMALATLALLTATVGIAPLRALFGFDVPAPGTLALAVGVGLASLPLLLMQIAADGAWRRRRRGDTPAR